MRLLRGKIAGHFVVKNSDWFTCDRQLTLIVGEEGSGKTTILRGLRSICPPLYDESPAPFADYPRFVSKAGYQRKVLVEKKTAVIAVFVCDDSLREELVAIDPVFNETDRIEVGRRLDASSWMTFIEIAASSRWSELVDDMEQLRKAERGRGDGELGGLFAVCDTLQPTDRIEGKVAADLRNLLAKANKKLTEDSDLHGVIDRARFLVDRAERFTAARELVRKRLPFMHYLRADGLLHGRIDLAAMAQGLAAGDDMSRHGLDLYFLALFGVSPELLRKRGAAAAAEPLQKALSRQSPWAEITKLARQWLPHCGLDVTALLRAQCVELLAGCGGDPVSLDALPLHLRWLVSCAVVFLYYRDVVRRRVVLLLDEPDADCGSINSEELFEALHGLSGDFQCLVTSTRIPAAREGGRAYVLSEENGESVLRPLTG